MPMLQRKSRIMTTVIPWRKSVMEESSLPKRHYNQRHCFFTFQTMGHPKTTTLTQQRPLMLRWRKHLVNTIVAGVGQNRNRNQRWSNWQPISGYSKMRIIRDSTERLRNTSTKDMVAASSIFSRTSTITSITKQRNRPNWRHCPSLSRQGSRGSNRPTKAKNSQIQQVLEPL